MIGETVGRTINSAYRFNCPALVTTHMAPSNASESPLEAASGAAGPHALGAFELLGNETRLAILLALWEAYQPRGDENALTFSALFERVGTEDSGNFNYHLNKLTEHFVEETEDGYQLRNAGHRVVQAVIAGVGLKDSTLPPTEIQRSCHRCGATVELSYEDERLYQVCTSCEGNFGPDSKLSAPEGTLMAWDYNPAGLARRSPEDVYVAGSIEFIRDVGLMSRGICPECSGTVDGALHICESHDAPPGEVCSGCGTRDKVRVSYVCSVCKHWASFPLEAAIQDHPAVIAFCYEHGIQRTYSMNNPDACDQLWDHLMAYEHRVLSEDPIRVRVTVPADEDELHLTLKGNLEVVDVTRAQRDSANSTGMS